MELFLNEEKIDVIRYYLDHYPLEGITTNPKMLGSLGKVDYSDMLKQLRDCIGDKKFFTQVTSPIYEEILDEAEYICSLAGKGTYIKVPANEVGIKAIRTLHERGYNTLGTLCFNSIQAIMALHAGADYVAVFYNHIVNAGYDASRTLSEIAAYIRESGCKGKLMGVGCKTIQEFGACVSCGSNAISFNATNITEWIMNEPSIRTAKSFIDAWEATWGEGKKIIDFIK